MQIFSRREMLFASGGTIALAACGKSEAQGNAANRPARPNLYACEGCEPTFQRDPATLKSDAVVALHDDGEPLIVEGVVIQSDGRTPAPGIVVYMHQTNAGGLYANGTNENEWSRRHGRLRGWAVTDAEGRYRFRTIKPAPYPDMTLPAHIHLMIGEPGREAYYIDDIVFDGELKVDARYRANQEFRGGSGIVKLSRDKEGRWLAVRNIVLERHP